VYLSPLLEAASGDGDARRILVATCSRMGVRVGRENERSAVAWARATGSGSVARDQAVDH